MSLLRVLHAELLKMKRTIALSMVLLAPSVVFLPVLFLVSQSPYTSVHRNGGIAGEWTDLTRLNLRLWAFLLLPLYVTLQTALVAGVDHAENQWKSLLARPVPRWTVYVAKLIVATAMLLASTLLLACGILLDGAVLPHLTPEVFFRPPVPYTAIVMQSADMAVLMFAALTIQHWVSLRWRPFSIAIGTGIVATVTGFFATVAGRQTGGWPQYFPWSLPMLVMSRQQRDLDGILFVTVIVGIALAAAGCADFSRREVQ